MSLHNDDYTRDVHTWKYYAGFTYDRHMASQLSEFPPAQAAGNHLLKTFNNKYRFK